MAKNKKYKSKNIGHLGLVAAMCDEIKLSETIDQLIPQDREKRTVSVGQAVKAMILNGLGFANRALYLTPHFFQDKPVDRLIGSGIKAEHLNDDVLGRTLDAIYDYGPTKLYTPCAIKTVCYLDLCPNHGHLDSTSIHTDGTYNSKEEEQDGIIRITKGYSRDHRPDLNQIILQLICEQQAGIPLMMQTTSGNKDDKTSFRETIKSYIKQLNTDFGMEYIIADSAMYTAKTIKEMHDFWWITRVPETVSLACDIIHAVAPDLMYNPEVSTSCSLSTTYSDVRQRWVVVFSPEAHKRAIKTSDNKTLTASAKELKQFQDVCKQDFACEADARKAVAKLEKTLKATSINDLQITATPHFNGKGRPAKDKEPDFYIYHIEAAVSTRLDYRNKMIQRKSCFIIATNQLDCESLTADEVIKNYKDQQKVEHGFRFIKDPMFMASTIFLKSPQRIMALMMVMSLCLMVYAALEYKIRQDLQASEQKFVDQKGKATARPTARWVFQFFKGIHVLIVKGAGEVILNLNELHRNLLEVLGKSYQRLYAASG